MEFKGFAMRVVMVLAATSGILIGSQAPRLANSEGQLLWVSVKYGLITGLIGGAIVLLNRFLKREPLRTRARHESPRVFYFGLAVFSGFSVFSFAAHMPLFSAFFAVFALGYACGLVAYKRGWRG